MTLSLPRMIAGISVRSRIILLAAIPVAGFLVNGIVYTAGEREVENAFRIADRASDLAEVSREHPKLIGAIIGRAIYEGTIRVADAINIVDRP